MFEKAFTAGWGDMDFNGHMKNTAFLDRAADVRLLFFAEHGFPMTEFSRLKLGPVIQKDELSYHRELALLEEFRVSFQAEGLSEDGSRFIIRNEILRLDGKLCATITSTGGWLDLVKRKLVEPPPELHKVLFQASRTSNFQILRSSISPA